MFKNTISFISLILLLALSISVFAKDKELNKVSFSSHSWEFNEDNNFGGWNMVNSLTGTVAEGKLNLKITGDDPYIVTDGQTIDAARYSKLVIRMKNNTIDTNMDVFFFSSDYAQDYSMDRYFNLTTIANDTGYTTYEINVAENEYWTGDITVLRIDPTNANAGSIDIDYIALKSDHSWDFNNEGDFENWVLANNLSGNVTNGDLHLDVQGDDPHMVILDLNFDASKYNQMTIRMKNNTSEGTMEVFYFSSDYEQDWSGDRYFTVGTTANDTGYTDYVLDCSQSDYWTGNITVLRIDPTVANTGSLDIDYITFSTKEDTGEVVMEPFTLDNGILKVKLDLDHGGAISYISKSGEDNNYVNTPDNGRYIQQAYAGGQAIDRSTDGQHSSYQPWYWNPMQAGSVSGSSSTIVDTSSEDGVLYVKTQPMLFDMTSELAECYMETWVTLENNVISVQNKLTNFRTDDLWQVVPRWNELPHAFISSEFKVQYTYMGDEPWTGAPVAQVFEGGTGWDYFNATEHWSALVNESNWGIGVYNENCTKFSGGYVGAYGFSRISPLDILSLDKNSTYEYNYDLIIGSVDEIRQYVYDISDESADTALATEWDFEEDLQKWYAGNNLSTTVENGEQLLTINGIEANVNSPYGLNIDADDYKYIQIKMKNNTDSDDARLCWITNYDTEVIETNIVPFSVTANDDDHTVYTIDLSENSDWYGRIEQIVIYPADSASSGKVSIDEVKILTEVTGVEDETDALIPDSYNLSQNYPNPFNPSTTINYNLPQSNHVSLNVYNVLGEKVATLVNSEQAAGSYTVKFDASRLATGLYIYSLQAGEFVSVKKMLLIK